MARIVIALPDQYKELVLSLQAIADRVVELGKRGGDGKAVDYTKMERDIGAAAARSARRAAPPARSASSRARSASRGGLTCAGLPSHQPAYSRYRLRTTNSGSS